MGRAGTAVAMGWSPILKMLCAFQVIPFGEGEGVDIGMCRLACADWMCGLACADWHVWVGITSHTAAVLLQQLGDSVQALRFSDLFRLLHFVPFSFLIVIFGTTVSGNIPPCGPIDLLLGRRS
jgi:hypothetical protein